MSGVHIDYAKYMLLALLICIGCALAFIVLGQVYISFPAGHEQAAASWKPKSWMPEGALCLSRVQKTVLVFLFLLVILLLAPNFAKKISL